MHHAKMLVSGVKRFVPLTSLTSNQKLPLCTLLKSIPAPGSVSTLTRWRLLSVTSYFNVTVAADAPTLAHARATAHKPVEKELRKIDIDNTSLN
jgi:hypothetical protein